MSTIVQGPENLSLIHISFPDLLRSVVAVLTKPGYGNLTAAASNGSSVHCLGRCGRPDQDFLID